jgi:hypothetical protein
LHAPIMCIKVVLTLLAFVNAVVLGVALYGITRQEDHEIALLALASRIAEGVLNAVAVLVPLALLWLAASADGATVTGAAVTHTLAALLLKTRTWITTISGFRAVGLASGAWPAPVHAMPGYAWQVWAVNRDSVDLHYHALQVERDTMPTAPSGSLEVLVARARVRDCKREIPYDVCVAFDKDRGFGSVERGRVVLTLTHPAEVDRLRSSHPASFIFVEFLLGRQVAVDTVPATYRP